MEITCAVCGIGFTKGSVGRTPLYCTDICQRRAKDLRRKGRYTSRASAPLHTQCIQCGNGMPEGKRSDARFCSERCFRRWNVETNGYERVSQAIEHRSGTCVCGKDISEQRANTKYCSVKCNQLSNRLNKYGITYQEYFKLLAKQGNTCAICGSMEWGPKGPALDHCHFSGRVRGLLCNWCNQGLGIFEDDITRLQRAIEYLK